MSSSCIKKAIKGLVGMGLFLSLLAHAGNMEPVTLTPHGTPVIQNPNSGTAKIEYRASSNLKKAHWFALVTNDALSQNVAPGYCTNPFVLDTKDTCLLSLNIDRNQLAKLKGGPKICATTGPNDRNPGGFLCSQPAELEVLSVSTIDPNFPYGSAPVGDVCVSKDFYATPETMLGSWAMIQAVSMDQKGNVLPAFLNSKNTVYAVGTAAIGNLVNIPNCAGGCNDLNGFCFALKFTTKTPYPYMIFQSVNIAANPDSFDIYMAGGGSGAFPDSCKAFWGTGNSVDWSQNIQHSSCTTYFSNFTTIKSKYKVTYNSVTYTAKDTLKNACTFASNGKTGFNTMNWDHVKVVPVTCPQSLVQITGVARPASITKLGNPPIPIHNLSTLTDKDFTTSAITVTTTQMQDCKTPSSGYCNNVNPSVVNYEASISANLTAPMLSGTPPPQTYCQSHPGAGYCSWNNGVTSGSDYCNTNRNTCIDCGGGSKWCTCLNKTLKGCVSNKG